MRVSSEPARPAEWLIPLGEPIIALTGSPDSAQIAALTTEGKLVIVEAATGRIFHELAAHPSGGFRVAWHPKAHLVASSGADGQVKFWDPATGKLLRQISLGTAWVEELEWSPTGAWLAVAAGRIVTLLTPDFDVKHTLKNHVSTVTGLGWRTDGQVLGVACYGGVQLYEARTGQPTELLPWKTSLVSLGWSPDQRWVVAGTQDMSVQIWPLPFHEGDELAMNGYPFKVRELAWHHSGKYLATGGDQQILVWDFSGEGPAGTTPQILVGHTARIAALAYQSGGQLLASGGQDGRLLWWNVRHPAPLGESQFAAPLTAVRWSRNDKTVIVGGQDGTVALVTPITK